MIVRVGLVIYGNLDINTGGYLYDRMLVDFLREQGDEVVLFSLPFRKYPFSIIDNFSSSFYHNIMESNLDIMLQDELNHPSLFLLNRRLKKEDNFPLITIVHHLSYAAATNQFDKALNNFLEKRYLSNIDGFIFNSFTNQKFVESFVGKSLTSVVAYPGRDHIQPHLIEKEIINRSINFDTLKIIFLGNIAQHKELHTLIRALSLINSEKWKLTIIGEKGFSPKYTKYINRLIKSKELSSQINFIGFVERSKLDNYLEQSHVLAVPSIYEGFGIVYLEALGFGLPVIASTGGAAKEIITHGKEGFLIPIKDPIALSNYISKLIEEPNLLSKMSICALRRYRDFPTWSKSMAIIREFLLSVVG